MRRLGGAEKNLNFYGNLYVGWGTPEHKEMSPSYDPDLPWISSDPDPDSEAWKKAAKVRRALSIAIDRQKIVDTLLRGEGQPLALPHWEAHLDKLPPELRSIEYNPEKARQLLTEAGYPNGFEVTLSTADVAVSASVAANEAIGAMWDAIGIDTRLETPPYASIRPSLYTHAGVPPDPLNYWSVHWGSVCGFSLGMDHPRVDELIIKAKGIVDEKDRYEVMVELMRFVYDNTLIVGVYSANIVWPLSARTDPWVEYMDKAHASSLSATEWAPHRN